MMKILVAVNDSGHSHQALQQALRLTNIENATFVLLSVEEPLNLVEPLSPSVPGLMDEIPAVWNPQLTTELVKVEAEKTQANLDWAELLCKQAGVQCQTCFKIGDPKQIICDVAKQKEIDLLVIGSRDSNAVERLLLGNVSDYVIHHAHCPVLVVR